MNLSDAGDAAVLAGVDFFLRQSKFTAGLPFAAAAVECFLDMVTAVRLGCDRRKEVTQVAEMREFRGRSSAGRATDF
jgi:hypothetical protein